jgi:hypothetical protein
MADDDFDFSDDFDNANDGNIGSPNSNEPAGSQTPPPPEQHYHHHQQQQQQQQQQHHHQHHAAPAPFPLSMDALRLSIERFLLPRVEISAVTKSQGLAKAPMTPTRRLDDMCLKIAISDHIRTLQTIYRDPSDEMSLGKDMRLLYDELNDGTKLNTKTLTTKIIDGRCKISALSRICHGDDSIQMLRCSLDLANAYALQGK